MAVKPQSQKQYDMLMHDAQIVVLGGAVGGMKTFTACMIPLRYTDCPYFNGIIFRRTTTQVRGQGGLWDTANDIFSMLDKSERPIIRQSDLSATWKNGAKLRFSHMEHVKNKLDHQGLQYTLVGFDEGTHFEWEQVEYLMSRMRSKSKYPSRMIITCNPDPDSWLYELVEWYLDEEGFPDKEKDGVIRWFIRKAGDFIWANTKEELIEKYSTKNKKVRPVSFSFLSSTIYDNKICLENNPEYVDWLEGLNPIERDRLLWGNWKVRPEGSNYFKRENLQKANTVPLNATCCRAWDKAAQIPTDIEKYPDFSASIKMYKTPDGEYYISGEYHPDNKDDYEEDLYGFFRAKPGKRDNIILKQSLYDGEECFAVMAQDPGAAGITEFQDSAKKLAQHGIVVKKDPVPMNKKKLTKFIPFASAVENHLVYIVENTFPNKKTLEFFLKQLEAYNGEDSTRKRKDEAVDICATAYNYLSKSIVIPKFTLPQSGINSNIRKLKAQCA